MKPDEKQELLEEVDVGQAPAPPLADPRARARGHLDRARRSSPRSSPRSTRASASSSCASSSRRSRRSSASSTSRPMEADELREQLDAIALPEDVRKQADRELKRLGAAAAGGRRARRHPHLPGVDRLAAVGQGDRGQPRPRPRARGARRGPLRHRAGQGPHPRVPRRAQAQARRARLDPLLRRAARRRQDVAGPVDRPRAGPRVRAHQRRRRARRGRDPRPPAHLHRRDAGHDHPRAARRGLQEPAVHDRRDRQDGRGLPRRPGQRDARGARPRAERRRSATTTSTSRSTSPT